MTVSESGIATFSVGIASTGNVKSLTLGIHQENYQHIDGWIWYDGIIIADGEKTLPDIINISRTAIKTKYSTTSATIWNPNPDTFDSNDIGKIFATNGHLFTSVATAKAAGATPLCIITCIKSMINNFNPPYSEGNDVQMQNGLAMGLYPLEVNGSTKLTWSDAKNNPSYRHCDSGVTVSCEGMPMVHVLQHMAQCCQSKAGNVVPTGLSPSLQTDKNKSYNSRALAELLAPAINAASGTNYSFSNLNIWTKNY